MMKILTVVYIMKYLTQVINGANELYDTEFWRNFDKSKKYENLGMKALKGITLILLDLLEIPYMCIALTYQKNLITIGYIIFWFSILAIRDLTHRKKIKLNNFTNRIINIIDLSCFVYMFYILFLK